MRVHDTEDDLSTPNEGLSDDDRFGLAGLLLLPLQTLFIGDAVFEFERIGRAEIGGELLERAGVAKLLDAHAGAHAAVMAAFRADVEGVLHVLLVDHVLALVAARPQSGGDARSLFVHSPFFRLTQAPRGLFGSRRASARCASLGLFVAHRRVFLFNPRVDHTRLSGVRHSGCGLGLLPRCFGSGGYVGFVAHGEDFRPAVGIVYRDFAREGTHDEQRLVLDQATGDAEGERSEHDGDGIGRCAAGEALESAAEAVTGGLDRFAAGRADRRGFRPPLLIHLGIAAFELLVREPVPQACADFGELGVGSRACPEGTAQTGGDFRPRRTARCGDFADAALAELVEPTLELLNAAAAEPDRRARCRRSCAVQSVSGQGMSVTDIANPRFDPHHTMQAVRSSIDRRTLHRARTPLRAFRNVHTYRRSGRRTDRLVRGRWNQPDFAARARSARWFMAATGSRWR